MIERCLFDTSVWIDFFAGKHSDEVELLTWYLEEDLPVFICPVIIQEILQGVKFDNDYEEMKKSLLALEVLSEDPLDAAIGAAEIYRKLRKNGVTIRKSNDCLIAWYAFKNFLEVKHNDRDFDLILQNRKLLKI